MNPGIFQIQQQVAVLVPRRQVFLQSGTWNRPQNCRAIRVTVIGGGGTGTATGGCPSTTFYSGGNGGIGAVTIIDPPSSVQVTVGGTAGASSFGSFLSATGGTSYNSGAATAGVGMTLETEVTSVSRELSFSQGVSVTLYQGSATFWSNRIAGLGGVGSAAGQAGAVVVEWIDQIVG